MDNRDHEAMRIAASANGVVTRRQALAIGMTEAMILRRLRSGAWRSMGRGLYLLGLGSEKEALLHAAAAAMPAVVSHETAAERHGLAYIPHGRLVVTVPHRRTNRFPGIQVHESTDLEQHHVVVIDGVPHTSPPRTVVDLAAVFGEDHLRKVIGTSVVTGVVDLDHVATVFGEVGRRGKPGTAKMRRILADLHAETDGIESELERRLVALIERSGLPHPDRQYRPSFLDRSAGRVDLAYPDRRLLIEADGKRWHTRVRDFEVDRRRDNLAQLAGWSVLRFTWSDVTDHPDRVVLMIHQALTTPSTRVGA